MAIKHKAVNLQEDPSPRNKFNHLPSVATASLPAAASANEGSIVYDVTTDTVKFSDGSSWANIGADAALDLDGAYDNGTEIDGADATHPVLIGDGTIKVSLRSDGTNAAYTSVAAPSLFTSAASQDCKISCGTSKDIKVDVGTANRTVIFGGTTSTDVTFTTAASSIKVDASADNLTFAAGSYAVFTGSGTGKGLVIPSHASASPNAQDVAGAGNIFFEVDAKKLWVYDGTTWVGTVLA
jgi:hypothetical protein